MPRPETSEQISVFEQWYAGGCQFRKISENLGRPLATLYDWADRFGWEERANERNRKAASQTQVKAVQRTAKLLDDQSKAGALARNKGVEWLENNNIESASDALKAIKLGIDLERQALGLPDYVTKILNASDGELDDYIEEMESRRRASVPDSEGEEG